MPQLIAEVLAAWREAERLLERLPALDPDHETLALEVARLKQLYERVLDRGNRSQDTIVAAERTLAAAHDMLRHARDRIGDGPRSGNGETVVAFHCFPKNDRRFRRAVTQELDGIDASDRDALLAMAWRRLAPLGNRYPRLHVTVSTELGTGREAILYVFRDGAVTPGPFSDPA